MGKVHSRQTDWLFLSAVIAGHLLLIKLLTTPTQRAAAPSQASIAVWFQASAPKPTPSPPATRNTARHANSPTRPVLRIGTTPAPSFDETITPAPAASPAAEAPANIAPPNIDVEAMRAQLREELREESLKKTQPLPGLAPRDVEIETQTRKNMAHTIATPQLPDCNTAYAGAYALALIPLAVNTVTHNLCKWYTEGDREALEKYKQ